MSLRMRSSLGFLAILTAVTALALLYPANVSAAPPADLRASLDGFQVVLSWTPGTNSNHVRQIILRKQSGTATGDRGAGTFQPAQWQEVATLSSGASTYTDSNVSNGQRYSYRVRAEKANGKGGISRLVSIKVREKKSPRATGLTASVQGGGVVLSWTPGTRPDYVRQIVLRRQKGGAWEQVYTTTDTSLNTWTDANTTPDQRYIYRVRAEKANNKGGMSAKVTVTAPPLLPPGDDPPS